MCLQNIAFKSFYHFTDDIEESRQFPNTDGPFLSLQIAANEEGFIIRALGTGWVKRYDHRLPLSNIQSLVITGSSISICYVRSNKTFFCLHDSTEISQGCKKIKKTT
ncbi:hypothetical protein B9Z55_025269 [Caenorhabditis nigoni]|uniref:Galectin domain-containing protein n=1 Tax=Caenorhabditis nigoni TaxID=1611254 RepID=A0A2G5SY40_9PELO|nr:hypothetical protein B9Z55_025269 [Caenorhabditis nigoni]